MIRNKFYAKQRYRGELNTFLYLAFSTSKPRVVMRPISVFEDF